MQNSFFLEQEIEHMRKLLSGKNIVLDNIVEAGNIVACRYLIDLKCEESDQWRIRDVGMIKNQEHLLEYLESRPTRVMRIGEYWTMNRWATFANKGLFSKVFCPNAGYFSEEQGEHRWKHRTFGFEGIEKIGDTESTVEVLSISLAGILESRKILRSPRKYVWEVASILGKKPKEPIRAWDSENIFGKYEGAKMLVASGEEIVASPENIGFSWGSSIPLIHIPVRRIVKRGQGILQEEILRPQIMTEKTSQIVTNY